MNITRLYRKSSHTLRYEGDLPSGSLGHQVFVAVHTLLRELDHAIEERVLEMT